MDELKFTKDEILQLMILEILFQQITVLAKESSIGALSKEKIESLEKLSNTLNNLK